jgi:capsular polysaccharide transport system permease protein
MQGDSVVGGTHRIWISTKVQWRVLKALMIRSVMMRYGHDSLGFFWLMGEPLLLTGGVMVMWSITGAEGGHNISVVPLALAGYSFITMWRHIVGHSVRAIHHNADLLFHRNVKILDVLFANSLLEFVGISSAFLIAYAPLSLYGVIDPIHDPLLLFGGFALTAWFSFSFGLIVTAITELSETSQPRCRADHVHHPAFYGCVLHGELAARPISNLILWSPLVSCVEMIRGGLFPPIFQRIFILGTL